MSDRLRLVLVTFVGAAMFLWPSVALAQVGQTPSAPRADVFGGLGVWIEDGGHASGLQLSGAFYPGRHVGIVGDFTFYEFRTTAMGGVRFFGTGPKVSAFAQVLVGTAPLDDFAIQPGFGVDVHLGSRTAIRVAGDVKIAGDDGSTYIGGRFSTGIVLRVGRQ